jgi:hypothetical protein
LKLPKSEAPNPEEPKWWSIMTSPKGDVDLSYTYHVPPPRMLTIVLCGP